MVAAAPPQSLMCRPEAVEFDNFDSTSLFHTLAEVRAVPSSPDQTPSGARSIAEARGYTDEQLYAVADLGYHYFHKGGVRLAEVLFDGLVAVKPDEAYFWLGLGVASDLQGNKPRAMRCYERAKRLDPSDPHAELNLAELHLEAGDRRQAVNHLNGAVKKAQARRLREVERKARAMFAMLAGATRTTGQPAGARR